MHKKSEGIGSSTRKITGTLLHREDFDFRINDSQKQTGLMKKKDSEDIQLLGIKLSFLVYVIHVIILDIKL